MAVKHKDLKKVVGELKGAVKAHGKQAKTIEQHIKDMESPVPFKMNGFPEHAGVSPVKKKGPCWEGYEMIGMKKKGGRTVPNCVPKK